MSLSYFLGSCKGEKALLQIKSMMSSRGSHRKRFILALYVAAKEVMQAGIARHIDFTPVFLTCEKNKEYDPESVKLAEAPLRLR